MLLHLASPIASLKEKLAKSEIDIIQESESPLGALHALDPSRKSINFTIVRHVGRTSIQAASGL